MVHEANIPIQASAQEPRKHRYWPAALWLATSILFLVSLPVFLVSTNTRWAINEPRLYNWGFGWFDIEERTDIPQEQLQLAGQQIRDYFNNDEEFLSLHVFLEGSEISLYSEREVLHMRDVKKLVQGVYWGQYASFTYLLTSCIMAFHFWRRRGLAWSCGLVTKGALLTVGLVAGLGLASLVAWRQVFLLFHYISFDNMLWMLNPHTDYLIQMFPATFFLTATVLIAAVTIVECAILVLLARWFFGRVLAKPS